MVDMTLIQGAVTGLKTASDIAKSFLQLKSLTDVQGKVIELQSAIMSAQSSALAAQSDQFAMLEQIRALKEEIAQVKAWETEKQRYQMANPLTGGIVYALKHSMCNGQPAHYICANCYENGKRSILQDGREKDKLATFLFCPACKTQSPTGYNAFPSRKYAEEIKKE